MAVCGAYTILSCYFRLHLGPVHGAEHAAFALLRVSMLLTMLGPWRSLHRADAVDSRCPCMLPTAVGRFDLLAHDSPFRRGRPSTHQASDTDATWSTAEVQVLSVSHRRRGSILLDEPPVSPCPPGSLMAGNMLERANTAEDGALDTSPRTVGPRQVSWTASHMAGCGYASLHHARIGENCDGSQACECHSRGPVGREAACRGGCAYAVPHKAVYWHHQMRQPFAVSAFAPSALLTHMTPSRHPSMASCLRCLHA